MTNVPEQGSSNYHQACTCVVIGYDTITDLGCPIHGGLAQPHPSNTEQLDEIFDGLEAYVLHNDFYPSSAKRDIAKAKKDVEKLIATHTAEARTQGAVEALENMARLFEKQPASKAKKVAQAIRMYATQLRNQQGGK